MNKRLHPLLRLYKLLRLSEPTTTLSTLRRLWRTRIAQLGLLGLSSLVASCSDHHVTDPARQSRVQAAVDSVRHVLEDSLGQPVPSLTVLIQTPTQVYLASSVPVGRQPLTPRRISASPATPKTLRPPPF